MIVGEWDGFSLYCYAELVLMRQVPDRHVFFNTAVGIFTALSIASRHVPRASMDNRSKAVKQMIVKSVYSAPDTIMGSYNSEFDQNALNPGSGWRNLYPHLKPSQPLQLLITRPRAI